MLRLLRKVLQPLQRIDPAATRGDPESPLRWTCKSTRALSAEMFAKYGLRVGDKTVARLLRSRGYSLQAAPEYARGRKAAPSDRDGQFEYINGI